MDHEYYMREALASARRAASEGETPVGAVIVKDGKIIGRGRNATERRDATCHAEIEAIREAAKNAGDWRLDGASIYVTMEPCPMCAGAIMNSRISRVFFGARDKNRLLRERNKSLYGKLREKGRDNGRGARRRLRRRALGLLQKREIAFGRQ